MAARVKALEGTQQAATPVHEEDARREHAALLAGCAASRGRFAASNGCSKKGRPAKS